MAFYSVPIFLSAVAVFGALIDEIDMAIQIVYIDASRRRLPNFTIPAYSSAGFLDVKKPCRKYYARQARDVR